MKLPRRNGQRGRIEIIPMIDTILILLIFYMTFSTFCSSEKALEARLLLKPRPGTEAGDTPPPPPEIVLHVFDRNRIVVNGHTVFDVNTLRAMLAQVTAGGLAARVVIEAEPATRYEDVVNTLDACALARLTQVGFRQLPE
ncbi:biopolymer transporter ExbD [bacterium]|nr:biopolymer transporter ExbD [bacterium]